jgi:DNA-binding Lrp family transcriptional regulator
LVSLKQHNKKNINIFLDKINKVNNVIECHHITGTGDFILKVVSENIASYQKLMLDKVSEIEATDSLQSMVILSTFKDNKVMPL